MSFEFWSKKEKQQYKEKQFYINAACSSDKGLRRPENEDNFFFDGEFLKPDERDSAKVLTSGKPAQGPVMLAVFDGMGGGDYGEIASLESALAARDYLLSRRMIFTDITPSLTDMCNRMNARVYQKSGELDAHMMGSTMAALFFYSDRFWVCNLGDSRVYGFRNGQIARLSVDHTDELLMKEQGITGRKPYLIQYLGINPEESRIVPYIASYPYVDGERFLICSDGVTDMIDEQRITEIILRSENPSAAVNLLIKEAKEKGGKDNITAIVCFISHQ